MTTAELAPPAERAVLARVRGRLAKLERGCRIIGIRSTGTPRWSSAREVELDGTPVRIVECPSVLAVLDALATADATAGDEVTVVLTDLPEHELGDAVFARLHRGELLEADRYTQLIDLLGARALDPRIRRETWLVDALIELAEADQIPQTTGAALSWVRAVALVVQARLGIEPDEADLPRFVEAFDHPPVRARWRQLPSEERAGLVGHLADRHGPGVGVVAALAERDDDVLAQLLVAHVLTGAPETDVRAAGALGGYQQARFGASPRPSRRDLAAAAAAAIAYARNAPSARLSQQCRVAEATLEALTAIELVAVSPVLPRGFVDRLAAAAQALTKHAFDVLSEHHNATGSYRVERVQAAARLRRWLEIGAAGDSAGDWATAAAGVAHHARETAWVDRALTQVRAGDADPRVAAVLAGVGRQASVVRARLDTAFAARFASMDSTPANALAVETLLPRVVAPLAKKAKVLFVVLDGMSGAIAGELAEEIAGRRTGWTEIVRTGADGARDAVLAAMPTETKYSRTSLFCAQLRSGEQSVERSVFPTHSFWPPGGATLIHKAGVAGRDGSDLGAELEAAVGDTGPQVAAVVLNAIDDSLGKGRQADDPAWRLRDVPGLSQLLDRAVNAGRVVLLTSDHGHVLEHGAEHRPHPGAAARWRPDDGAARADEVVAGGPRMLLPQKSAILAATEDVRYGARAHGYHGGATLAEAAIPLIGLLPPGVSMPEGWAEYTLGPPSWWDDVMHVRPALGGAAAGDPAPAAQRPAPKKNPARKAAAPDGEGLFVLPAEDAASATRGARLVASARFREARAEIPANRAPAPAVFHQVVDALVDAGGRLPIGGVVQAAGAAGRNPRALVTAMRRVLNRDSFSVLELVDGGRAVELNVSLLDEQFPPDDA
ncbi:MAG: BREX-2 system phosphatase PglZ [Pseudonocardia sp.]